MSEFSVEYKGRSYRVARRRELTVNGYIPWCIDVDDQWYQLTADATDADNEARRFLRYTMRNSPDGRVSLLASRRYPLLLSIDGVAVRAWPAFAARGQGSTTFVHPSLNRRVRTDRRDPVWMFESTGREASASGTMYGEQSVDDVRDLGTVWIRSQ